MSRDKSLILERLEIVQPRTQNGIRNELNTILNSMARARPSAYTDTDRSVIIRLRGTDRLYTALRLASPPLKIAILSALEEFCATYRIPQPIHDAVISDMLPHLLPDAPTQAAGTSKTARTLGHMAVAAAAGTGAALSSISGAQLLDFLKINLARSLNVSTGLALKAGASPAVAYTTGSIVVPTLVGVGLLYTAPKVVSWLTSTFEQIPDTNRVKAATQLIGGIVTAKYMDLQARSALLRTVSAAVKASVKGISNVANLTKIVTDAADPAEKTQLGQAVADGWASKFASAGRTLLSAGLIVGAAAAGYNYGPAMIGLVGTLAEAAKGIATLENGAKALAFLKTQMDLHPHIASAIGSSFIGAVASKVRGAGATGIVKVGLVAGALGGTASAAIGGASNETLSLPVLFEHLAASVASVAPTIPGHAQAGWETAKAALSSAAKTIQDHSKISSSLAATLGTLAVATATGRAAVRGTARAGARAVVGAGRATAGTVRAAATTTAFTLRTVGRTLVATFNGAKTLGRAIS